MEIQKHKHVQIICSLEVGQMVKIEGWGYKFDGKQFKIEDIKQSDVCESGFLVKINGYENYLDSNWITII